MMLFVIWGFCFYGGVVFAQKKDSVNKYQDSRIFGTWEASLLLDDCIIDKLPNDLINLYSYIKITFNSDLQYHMTVDIIAIETKIIYKIFAEKNHMDFKIINTERITAEGYYSFNGEELYIESSESRLNYLNKIKTFDFDEQLVDSASINIGWDLNSFIMETPNPFPGITERFITKKITANGAYYFTKFNKIKR